VVAGLTRKPDPERGLTVLALDEHALAWIASNSPGGGRLDLGARYLDKLAFRGSYEPEAEYMLVDGIGTLEHGHKDAGCILRLDWGGRIWIVDSHPLRSATRCHAGPTVVREGTGALPPPSVRLEGAAEGSELALAQMGGDLEPGMAWTRSLVWAKGRFFIVFDTFTANEPGLYKVRLTWPVLGDARITPSAFTSRQDGHTFTIASVDPARRSLVVDRSGLPCDGSPWAEYPHAKGEVTTYEQRRAAKLDAGDRMRFVNLLYAGPDNEPRDYRAVRVSDTLLSVDGPEGTEALVWIRPEGEGRRWLQADAALLAVGRDTLVAAGAIEVAYDGCAMKATRPVSIAFNLAAKKGTIRVDRPSRVTFEGWGLVVEGGRSARASLGESVYELAPGRYDCEWSAALRAPADLAADAPGLAIPTVPVPVRAVADFPHLERVFEYTPRVRPRAMELVRGRDDWRAVIGALDGTIFALDPDWGPVWDAGVPGAVSRIVSADLDGDGHDEIVAGTSEGELTVIACETPGAGSRPRTAPGDILWSRRLGGHRRRKGCVTALAARRLESGTGDESGSGAILAGTTEWLLYRFAPSGDRVWGRAMPGRTPVLIAVAETDGGPLVLAGCVHHASVAALDPAGEILWTNLDGTDGSNLWATALAVVDAGDAGPLAVYGTSGHRVAAIRLGGTGSGAERTVWSEDIGGEVRAIAMVPAGEDGSAAIVAASEYGDLVAFSPEGRRLWQQDSGLDVRTMVRASERPDDARLLAIADGGEMILVGAGGEGLAAARARGRVIDATSSRRDGADEFVILTDYELVALRAPEARPFQDSDDE
jgi:outer membrane protein assembly factor BamB